MCGVCGVFFIGNKPLRYKPPSIAASQFPLSQYYCYWVPAMKELWCDVHQFSVLFLHQSSVLRLIKCIVNQSPMLHLPRVLHQSTLLRLLLFHHSPIFSVVPSTSVVPIDTVAPSTSAPFTNLQCYTFYKGCTNLHWCAFYKCCTHCHCCASTVAPFYSVDPFGSCYFVPCDYATRQFYITNNLATDVNTPC